jgi:hypothetical protein
MKWREPELGHLVNAWRRRSIRIVDCYNRALRDRKIIWPKEQQAEHERAKKIALKWRTRNMSLIDRFISRVSRRKPDFIIGSEKNPYCYRWWIIPRNRFFNIYLHNFVRDDDDRALHDHPWINCTIPLKVGYVEQQFKHKWQEGWALPVFVHINRRVGKINFRRASTPHRVILRRDGNGQPIPSWSLFITGPVIREWGFICPGGRWVHWKKFTDFENTGKSGLVGRGCNE